MWYPVRGQSVRQHVTCTVVLLTGYRIPPMIIPVESLDPEGDALVYWAAGDRLNSVRKGDRVPADRGRFDWMRKSRMEAMHIDDRAAWNHFVAANADAHICQTYEWPEQSDDEARTKSLHLGVVEDGALRAAVVLVHSRAQGVPAPFFYAPRGPVCDDPNSPALSLLLDYARREARKRGAFMIRLEPNALQDDETWLNVLKAAGYRRTNHSIYLRGSWVTDIGGDDREILAGMSASWRRYVNYGPRNGLTVREGAGEDDLDQFYRLLEATGRRDHFHVYPKELFSAMLDHYSADCAESNGTAHMRLLLAEYDGKLVGAVTVAVLGKWAWYLHGASSDEPDHRKLRPNHALQWTAMRWARSLGAVHYDWRTIPDVLEPGEDLYGVYLFKRGFGGYERRVIPTHDLVLRPALYWPYDLAVTARREIQRMRSRRRRVAQTEKAAGD